MKKHIVTMQLMTKELEARFKEVGNQEYVNDPIVIARYFHPTKGATWYATEYYPETKMFYGYVSIFNDYNDEWGKFSLEELEEFTDRFGLSIARELYFKEFPISEVLERKKKGYD